MPRTIRLQSDSNAHDRPWIMQPGSPHGEAPTRTWSAAGERSRALRAAAPRMIGARFSQILIGKISIGPVIAGFVVTGSLIAAPLLPPVLVAAMALTGLWNWAIERLAYRPLRGSFRLALLISAIGMSIFLSNFVQVVQGPRNKPAPQLPNHVFNLTGGTYDVTLSVRQILIMVITVVLLAGFWYLVQHTSLGPAQRACEQDRKMAALLGIDVDRDDLDHLRHRRRLGGSRRGHVCHLLRRGEFR